MSQTITNTTTLQCPHGGTVQIQTANTKAKAEGGYVATVADTFVVSGCTFQLPGAPPIPSPCVKVQWLVSDIQVSAISNRVVSGTNSVGLCLAASGLPQGKVLESQNQTKVTSR